jgi:hypothetical protein
MLNTDRQGRAVTSFGFAGVIAATQQQRLPII